MLSAAICKQKPMILLYCEVNWFTPALALSIPCVRTNWQGSNFGEIHKTTNVFKGTRCLGSDELVYKSVCYRLL